ncbi:transposable element Tcb2 transposase [Trichonephila clavipes]|nr:transposable element Tcb2 transposase [Trichonephila clavipes]
MPLHRFRKQYEQEEDNHWHDGSWVVCLSCHLHEDHQHLQEGRPRQTSPQEHSHIIRNVSVQVTVSTANIQAQIAPSLEELVSSRSIRRHLAEGHLGSRRPLRVLPLTPTHRHLYLEWCHTRGNWTAVELNQVIFSDESRFNLTIDDKRVRVWNPRRERLNPAFALHRYTAPTNDVMVWDDIAYNTRSPLVLIRGTMTYCNHICCHSCNGSQEPSFNKTMIGFTK